MKRNEEYWGVYDYKESDTFRPDIKDRIHKDYPYGKTITCRSDSCCVIMRGGYDLMEDNIKLRIRKLTPRECGRLMGIKDEDIDLILENQTNASAYHLFGDSIVVNCLMAIYGELFNKNWEDYFKPKEWWKNE